MKLYVKNFHYHKILQKNHSMMIIFCRVWGQRPIWFPPRELKVIYLVCGNTMWVSTCQVEFALKRTVLLYILLPLSRFLEFGRLFSSEKNLVDFWNSGDFSVLKRTVLLFNFYLGGEVENQTGQLLQPFSNFTTTKWVLNWS